MKIEKIVSRSKARATTVCRDGLGIGLNPPTPSTLPRALPRSIVSERFTRFLFRNSGSYAASFLQPNTLLWATTATLSSANISSQSREFTGQIQELEHLVTYRKPTMVPRSNRQRIEKYCPEFLPLFLSKKTPRFLLESSLARLTGVASR
jgi:hypothetical protein